MLDIYHENTGTSSYIEVVDISAEWFLGYDIYGHEPRTPAAFSLSIVTEGYDGPCPDFESTGDLRLHMLYAVLSALEAPAWDDWND
jgi:hypothetical protein